MEEVFREGLCIIGSQRGYHCNDHFPNRKISMGFKPKDLVCCVEKVFFHELEHCMIRSDVLSIRGTYHSSMEQQLAISKQRTVNNFRLVLL